MPRVFMNEDGPLKDYELADLQGIVARERQRLHSGTWDGRPWPDSEDPRRLKTIYSMTTEQLIVICEALLRDVDRCRSTHTPKKKKAAKTG